MNCAALESLDKETLVTLVLAQAESIVALTRQVGILMARVAEFEARLGLPPKTPDNSSTPPSQSAKPSGGPASAQRRKPHPGAHLPLHPDPTSRRDVRANACQHCGADVCAVPQAVCEAYDHVGTAPVTPEVTRVSLHGGTCPCCAKTFKAACPLDMSRGSPFGPNLRALVIHLHFTQGIAFERLARLLSELLGLAVSQGALVNMLAAAGRFRRPNQPLPRRFDRRERAGIG
jgi:transposase